MSKFAPLACSPPYGRAGSRKRYDLPRLRCFGNTLIAVALIATCLVGCREDVATTDGPTDTNAESGDAKSPDAKAGNIDGDSRAVAPTIPEPTLRTVPEVKLSDQDRATCLVGVSDAMPRGSLPDFANLAHPLQSFFGERLTILCLWTNGKPPYGPERAAGLLEDLGKDYAKPFADQGLRVLGINVGDTKEAAGQTVIDAGSHFPCLFDEQGTYFATVATKKLPRIYLLDAEGKIVWFDFEYSEITREMLQQAVEASLAKPEPANDATKAADATELPTP